MVIKLCTLWLVIEILQRGGGVVVFLLLAIYEKVWLLLKDMLSLPDCQFKDVIGKVQLI